MLRHKAAIQCTRYAIGFAGIIDPDEAERSPEVITHAVVMAPPLIMPAEHETSTNPFDSTAFLTELKEAQAMAGDIETLEDIWSSHDPLSVLEGDDYAQGVVLKIKERCLATIDTGAAA